MSYRIAGIDVHKKMLAVVVADVEVEGEYQCERRRFGSNPEQLRRTPLLGYGAPHLSARGTSTLLNNALLSAHFRASDGLVTRSAAGYDYSGNWASSTGRTYTCKNTN